MQPGDEVIHPQFGKGTVLFDKEHCVGVRFLEHGHVNFSPEEWISQHSPASRLKNSSNDLEYSLQSAVENGDLSEDQALGLLQKGVHPLEVQKYRTPAINEAYQQFQEHPSDSAVEDRFYNTLLRHITRVIKSRSHDRSTYSNIEDSIQETALEVWQRLPDFDSRRSSFRSFVDMIALSNIKDAMRRFRTEHGGPQKPGKARKPITRSVEYDPEDPRQALNLENIPAPQLPADNQLAFKEFLKSLEPTDRAILQMLRDGLNQEEVGQVLSITQSAVAHRLIRLRREHKSPFAL